MAAKTARHGEDLGEDRPSGVPAPHSLGESKSEVLWLLLGAGVIVLIVLATWYQSVR